MIRATSKDIAARFANDQAVESTLNRAVREAVLRHKRLGETIAEWRDGQVVIVPPEEIVVDEEPDGAP